MVAEFHGPAESGIRSITRVGALVQGLPACNGWTFWHFEDRGARAPIDELHRVVRTEMAMAGA